MRKGVIGQISGTGRERLALAGGRGTQARVSRRVLARPCRRREAGASPCKWGARGSEGGGGSLVGPEPGLQRCRHRSCLAAVCCF